MSCEGAIERGEKEARFYSVWSSTTSIPSTIEGVEAVEEGAVIPSQRPDKSPGAE